MNLAGELKSDNNIENMNTILPKLVLYKNIANDKSVMSLYQTFKYYHSKEELSDRDISFLNEKIAFAINNIIDVSEELGISGNIWKKYLIYIFLKDENAFSLNTEKRKIGKNTSLSTFASDDFDIFRMLYVYDFSTIENLLNIKHFSRLKDYKCSERKNNESKVIRLLVNEVFDKLEISESRKETLNIFSDVYKEYGCGLLGFDFAFRVSENTDSLNLIPVSLDEKISLDDIIGYDLQKKKLKRNTSAFCSGKKSNDVLLYGDNGTGKSTSIKAILNEYKHMGLRLVELNKYQFSLLPGLISYLKKRNYKFIIFIDDLSFEENEIEYKFLKSAIEGGIESRPDNILIYATSNRRHLIKEMWDDRKDVEHVGEIHRSDTIEEKISLSSRFGETINFSRPNKKEYEEIVLALAEKEGIKIDKETLLKEADKWEIRHGGFTGRVARQFINHISSL